MSDLGTSRGRSTFSGETGSSFGSFGSSRFCQGGAGGYLALGRECCGGDAAGGLGLCAPGKALGADGGSAQ